MIAILSVEQGALITFLVKGKKYSYFIDEAVLNSLCKEHKRQVGKLFNEVKNRGERI